MGWEQEGEVVEVTLGAKDMILNAREIGHGFRVDGVEPVLMSISVDVGKPLPPVYHYHPKQHPSELARQFGAQPGKTLAFDRKRTHPLQQLMGHLWCAIMSCPLSGEAAGFTRKIYVGDAPGAIHHDTCRKEMWGLPAGVTLLPFTRTAEEAVMCLEGSVEVVWLDDEGWESSVELGPRIW